MDTYRDVRQISLAQTTVACNIALLFVFSFPFFEDFLRLIQNSKNP